MANTTETKRRVGKRTLILLWAWVICMVVVIDLFLNVDELDGIRPRAEIYRGMRTAAHKMVGEPIDGYDSNTMRAVTRSKAVGLADELARATDDNRPDVSRWLAANAADARVRIAALEKLGDRKVLLQAAKDSAQTPKVRRAAAKLLGRFGTMTDLEEIVSSKLPLVVRQGAILGMGELGSVEATERLLALAQDPDHTSTAADALAHVSNRKAGPVLRQAALDTTVPVQARVSICSALSRIKEPTTTRTLADVLADPANPAKVRAMAANSLGRLRDTVALATIAAAVTDENPAVARQARLTHTRLSHVK